MSSRPVAFSLILAVCLVHVGSEDAKGQIFSRSRNTKSGRSAPSPAQSYRQGALRLFGQGGQKRESEEEEKADSLFDGVERPPSAPRSEIDGSAASARRDRITLTGKPEDTLRLVDDAISRTKKRYLTVGEHTPWQIFHGLLALRHEFLLNHNGEMVRGLDWLRDGVQHDNLPLVEKTEHGARFHPFTIPWAFEGHVNQFLGILSLSALPREYQFRTPRGEIVTMGDMVTHAQKSMDGRGEMTWTLWFLTHYVEPDAEWENARGQYWSMERLVRMEARNKVNGAPCGGTHRLFALSLSRNAYLAKYGQVRSSWIEADQQVKKHIAITKSLQNRDGSFSSDWFKGRGYSTDLTSRLKTSGHILEWLMVALSEKQLQERWVQMAVQSVARDVIRSSREPAECGALYHALDSLVFYKQRVNPSKTPASKSPVYLVPPSGKQDRLAQLPQTIPESTQGTPSEFIAPEAAAPVPKPIAIPKTAALPELEVQPLAGDSTMQDTAKSKSDEGEPAEDQLVVEEIEPGLIKADEAAPIKDRTSNSSGESMSKEVKVANEPAKKSASETTAEASDSVVVEVVEVEPLDAPEAAESMKVLAPTKRDSESDPRVVESSTPKSPTDEPRENNATEDVVEVETIEVPADAEPMKVLAPTKPDAEADPRVVESSTPKSPTEETRENGGTEDVVEVEPIEVPADAEPMKVLAPTKPDAEADPRIVESSKPSLSTEESPENDSAEEVASESEPIEVPIAAEPADETTL